MKTIKLLAISMLLMSFSCSPEEVQTEQGCDCITTIYKLPVGATSYQWHQTGLPTDNELTCEDEMEAPLYYSAPNYFYQVTCN